MGDDTSVIDAVLACDPERTSLLAVRLYGDPLELMCLAKLQHAVWIAGVCMPGKARYVWGLAKGAIAHSWDEGPLHHQPCNKAADGVVMRRRKRS